LFAAWRLLGSSFVFEGGPEAVRPGLRSWRQLRCSIRSLRHRRLRSRVQTVAAAVERRAHAAGARQDVPPRQRVSSRLRVFPPGAGARGAHVRRPARGQRGCFRALGKGCAQIWRARSGAAIFAKQFEHKVRQSLFLGSLRRFPRSCFLPSCAYV
jgi:hypothetical protein